MAYLILGALCIAVLGGRVSHKVLILIGPLAQTIGYIIYGLSINGWMVILARLLIGINNGANVASVVSYYNYSVPKYNELALKLGKKQRPNFNKTLTLFYAFFGTLSNIPTLGNKIIIIIVLHLY